MPCAFCGNDRRLVKAHIIPKSFFDIDPTDKKPSRLVTNVAGRYTQKVPIGVYDAGIVCEECERRFSPWDDYAAELFLQSWERFGKIRDGGKDVGFTTPSYDYRKLKLFFLSLLWRAGVSRHVMFGKIELGPHEEALRAALRNCDAGDVHHYGVVLQAFDSTNVGILDPRPERFSGVRFYRFYLRQILAFIKVDRQPMPAEFVPVALDAGTALLIPGKNFALSPERKIMRSLVVKDLANQ